MKAYVGLVAVSTCAIAGDWLTYGHDPQRTSWAFEETKIAPDTPTNDTPPEGASAVPSPWHSSLGCLVFPLYHMISISTA